MITINTLSDINSKYILFFLQPPFWITLKFRPTYKQEARKITEIILFTRSFFQTLQTMKSSLLNLNEVVRGEVTLHTFIDFRGNNQ